jgi:hypothetical protein
MNNLKISLATLVAGAAFSTQAIAQSNAVSTPIVGFQKSTVSPGINAFGFPLINAAVLSGQVSTNTSSQITVSGSSNIGSALAPAEPYYIEISNGSLEGERYDVNVAATIAAGNNTITIDTASINNTGALSSGVLTGATLNIIKHVTLSQVQSLISGGLTGNNTVTNADQITIFQGGTPKTYYLRADGTSWRISGTTNNQAKVVVPPGSGIILKKVGAIATELISTGVVRGNNFNRNYSSGIQLNAPGFPLSYSPNSLGANYGSSTGWVGNNTQASADQIITFVAGTPKTYYLRSDGSSWRTSGTTNSFSASEILASDSAFYVKRANSAEVSESKL